MTEKSNPGSTAQAPAAGRILTTAGMILAISLISFSIFRGASNIVNALIIPLTLAVGAQRLTIRSFLAVVLALFGLTAVLFPLQMIFVIFYGGLAALIHILLNLRKTGLAFLIHTLAVSICFWLAILLTDLIFLTKMQAIMMQMLSNNYFAFAGLILFEGLIVGVSHLLLTRLIRRRIK
jgi:hypothetical protein